MAGLFPARRPSPTVPDSPDVLLDLRDRLDRSVALVDAALAARWSCPEYLRDALLDVRNVLRPPGDSSG